MTRKGTIGLRHALTIAGSDPSGGAGIQADLKTFAAFGVYGMSAITAATVQNTCGVREAQALKPGLVAAQIGCLFEDIRVDAVKIGMTADADVISAIAGELRKHPGVPVVLDPVMVSTSGHALLDPAAVHALTRQLLPLAALITPNLPETTVLTGREVRTVEDMRTAAVDLIALGARAVVVKGGHLDGDAVDVFFDGRDFLLLPQPRVATRNTHGTGCTFSSAVAAALANGKPLPDAVRVAKTYISEAIAHAETLGHGHGPVNHFYAATFGSADLL